MRRSPQHGHFLPITILLLCATALLAGPDSSDPASRRTRFHALLNRPRVPLHPTLQTETAGEFTIERGQFDSEKQQSVPFLLYRPTAATGRLAAVTVLHGTGG